MVQHEKRRLHGQALMEFALIGSVALLALTFLMSMGLRMNYMLDVEQQTMRRAMREATNLDKEDRRPPISYTLVQTRDRQLPDASDGQALMPRTSTQADAYVVWFKFLTFLNEDDTSKPRFAIRVNGTRLEAMTETIGEDDPLVSEVETLTSATGTTSQSGSTSTSLTSSSSQTSTVRTQLGDIVSGIGSSVNLSW